MNFSNSQSSRKTESDTRQSSGFGRGDCSLIDEDGHRSPPPQSLLQKINSLFIMGPPVPLLNALLKADISLKNVH